MNIIEREAPKWAPNIPRGKRLYTAVPSPYTRKFERTSQLDKGFPVGQGFPSWTKISQLDKDFPVGQVDKIVSSQFNQQIR